MTHTLSRTSNTDQMKGINTLDDDLVFLAMSGKGTPNDNPEAGPKMRKILEIAKKYNPVNIGDMKTGNVLAVSEETILNNVVDTSIVHAVYNNMDDAVAFVKEVKDADLGISVVMSAPFDKAWECAEKAGLPGIHTVNMSGGIWGKTEYLPAPEVNDFCTMCGHGMISRYFVEYVIDRVKNGKMTAKDGSVEIGKQCCCGIYNPDRGEKLINAIIGK